MKDKIAEKVMELYGKGVKQNVIAQQLNLSTAKVWRIINKNATKPEDEDFTDEDFEVYEETVSDNAPDDDPAEESASENPEMPGNSSQDNLDAPNNNPAEESPSENPEIPGNSSGFPEQMKTIAELTSAEMARKMTDSYKQMFDLVGSVNREILENSMSGMDKATRMLLTAAERLNTISEREEKLCVSCSEGGNEFNSGDVETVFFGSLLNLLLNVCLFSFGGICGINGWLDLAVWMCGILFAAAAGLIFVICIFQVLNRFRLVFSLLAVTAAIPSLFAGYFFFLIEKSIMCSWASALLGIPIGVIICLFVVFIIKRNFRK